MAKLFSFALLNSYIFYGILILVGDNMNEAYEKYLPIGSVVMLKNGKKRVMITGYATIDFNKKDKVYDYSGCLYPEGVITTNQNLVFNHNDIEKIYCLGYSDDEQKEFGKKLKEFMTEENMKKALEKAQTMNLESLNEIQNN